MAGPKRHKLGNPPTTLPHTPILAFARKHGANLRGSGGGGMVKCSPGGVSIIKYHAHGRGILSGMTLVELLIACVPALLMFGLFLSLFSSALDVTSVLSAQLDLSDNARVTLEQMREELGLSSQGRVSPIAAPPNNTSLTFQLPTDLNGDGTIFDASGNLEWNPASYTYARNAQNQLVRSGGGEPNLVLANYVIEVRFATDATYSDDAPLRAGEIRVSLTLQKQGGYPPRTHVTSVSNILRLSNP